jgi:hypothetical protein
MSERCVFLIPRMIPMAKLARLMSVAVILSFPLLARGNGLTLVRSPVVVANYYPAPVFCVPVVAFAVYPVCVPPPVCPVPPPLSAPSPAYAPPTAAPPSAAPSTPEPPLAAPPVPAKPTAAPPSRPLGFGESTSFFDTYPVASPGGSGLAGDHSKVDFWNLTGKDLVLRLDGEPPLVLPHHKDLPLTTGRQFTWQVEGREKQTTRFRDGESALQIVIRR